MALAIEELSPVEGIGVFLYTIGVNLPHSMVVEHLRLHVIVLKGAACTWGTIFCMLIKLFLKLPNFLIIFLRLFLLGLTTK
jgi:hypothetical protein